MGNTAWESLDFTEKKTIGRLGETFAINLFNSLNYTVQDMSAEKAYQEQDIDLIVETPLGRHTIEIKTDRLMWKTNNICIELITNTANRRKGWFRTSQAEYLGIYDSYQEKLHLVRFDEIRELFSATPTRIRTMREWEGSYLKEAEIALIPLSKVVELPSYIIFTADMAA